ncbi:undecaprenyldiphospho-muramoylpentapeptide beta-N-acetylglucosaminyltransferase [Candidatus Halobeggiatoa sp. HSG11]|nr:undecaprenyldiphospho-muramoylpentapeptide beta-N-acetylglucosaminyltransferase [Candidatus Halobeggiatoa sp. HSG11]
MNRILIMAGGTGGHVFPALAVAEALKIQGIDVCWLGTRKGLESKVVPAADIEIKYINIKGVRGKGILGLLLAPVRIFLAIWQSIRILRIVRPDKVIGFGGFVTGPGGVAAWLLGIPLLIHEQNAVAGLTNRWLAKIATQVMEAFPNTFPDNVICTGNPLRTNIKNRSATKSKNLHILVVGGSLGAKVLNEIVPIVLQQIPADIEVWHQTGSIHFEAMQQVYSGKNFKITAFIDDIGKAYAWADLVICRAGAITVSELAQAGVASILVPYPYAVDDHQTLNAKFLSAKQAAILLPQPELTVDKLTVILTELYKERSRLQTMAMAAKNCATPNALQQIVDIITDIPNSNI